MIEFIETIKILNGRVYNINEHNTRCYVTRRDHFESQKMINLRPWIKIPLEFNTGLIKCRITYNYHINKIEFERYAFRPIHSLKLMDLKNIDYNYKYQDRTDIQKLYAHRRSADDILMFKNGLITDTSYGNVALFNGKEWYTPTHPLLKGTQRSRLLRLKTIKVKDISIDNISEYSLISVFNAMIPIKTLQLSTDNIA